LYPTHIVLCFCFVRLRLVYPMLPVSLDCPFLIASSVFYNVYLYTMYSQEITNLNSFKGTNSYKKV
jgi:hypothetical protein